MEDAVIVSAVRTPIGTLGGVLSEVPVHQLGAVAVQEAVKRARVDPHDVDEVLLGNVIAAGAGLNPSRQASLAAGMPIEVPTTGVNKACGSGLKTIALAAQAIRLGDAEVVVAGGMESMSRAPYLLTRARTGYRLGHGQLLDSMITDGLWCPMTDCHMGITAENLAARYEITREDMDRFSAQSHHRAAAAWETGRFQEEVVPVSVPQPKGEPKAVARDEHIRPNSSPETLGKLRPAFKADGTVTAGNASGINDGAAATVVMSARKAQELGLQPLAVIRTYASAGVEPAIMGIGPVPAVRKALEKAGMRLGDMDLVELNEAFAAQSLSVIRELGLDEARTNVNGGAIALGHPVGCSGTRVMVTLLYEMKRRRAKFGLATLCIGGGQGIAMIVENAAA
ncbi:MAG: acetyl-CoA C-acetyltransferase [Chloroflexi bacterium]|nr:acetyl-CoA C-acetyltransferase [Chloroflexota bacterium]